MRWDRAGTAPAGEHAANTEAALSEAGGGPYGKDVVREVRPERKAAPDGPAPREDCGVPQSSSGDQAGSDAKLGLAIACSLRPVRSTE